MSLPTLAEIYAGAHNTELFRLCEPRRYTGYGPCNGQRSAVAARFSNYVTARTAQNEMHAKGSLSTEVPIADLNSRLAYLANLRSQEFGHPTYFVAPEFLKAVTATRLPRNLEMTDVRWPMQALTFIFPRGAIMSPFDGECQFLTIARIPDNWQPDAPLDLPLARSAKSSIVVYSVAEGNGCPLFALGAPIAGLTTEAWAAQEFPSQLYVPDGGKDFLNSHYNGEIDFTVGVPHEKDDAFITQLKILGLKLVLMMTAAARHVEIGTIARAAKVKGHKFQGELWNPNVIGRRYYPRSEPLGGTHASPRVHWRDGHIRAQPHGPRATPTYFDVWIEPVLVNVPN